MPQTLLDWLAARFPKAKKQTLKRMVEAGRVRVNGRVVRVSDTWVDPEGDRIELDGRSVSSARRLYLCLNKPKGYLTSWGDPRDRRTVDDLLGDAPAWVFPVGRLDRDTSGLLVFTNDSDFAERVTDPRFGLPKRYRVTTRARLEDAELEPLRRGLELDDGPTLPARAELIGHRGPTSVVELEIREGRNRQVRRMFQKIDRRVKELRRVAIGPLELGTLASGRWRSLTTAELRALRAAGGKAPHAQR